MTSDDHGLPIVAIGASAGGVKALQDFFNHMPEDSGAAFVVILHLSPDHESRLGDILASQTGMPVVTVSRQTELRPNTVYVIPPDRALHITDHEIATKQFEETRGHRSPIDEFFNSVADTYGDGFALILSGAGHDGAVGVKAIKEAGGIILVQDPREAEFASMPRSAVATGVADIVLPVSGLAEELTRLIRSKTQLQPTGSQPRNRTPGDDEEAVRRILGLLRTRVGHDFTKYKRSTVSRRIARRMHLARLETHDEYFDFLRDNADEASALFGDLLISVTTFFRDPEAFDALARRILPQLMKDRDANDKLRVWVAGCATGEEAYSIAMLLLEEAAKHENPPEVQIFASDLDATALDVARAGVYPAAIQTDVSEERLKRFFLFDGQYYRIRQEVRDLVLFSTHNLLNDPPFSRIDLISCRNLLIYLDRDLQQQVISTFNYAMLPQGYLFLGSSEGAESPIGLFRVVDRDARIYQSIHRIGDRLPNLPSVAVTPPATDWPAARPPSRSARGEGALHRQALEALAPPSILVDEAYHILHVSETAGRYLLHPAGPPTSDITELIRPELRMDLRSALHRALEQGQTSLSLPIPVKFNGTPQRVYLHVKPVAGEDQVRTALVLFIEGALIEQPPADNVALQEGRSADDVIQQLRDELLAMRSRLKASREEEDAANEELRAANEELQSINEEYRSTAEELETSKEELQSINEELQTLNNELKLKLENVSQAHNDLQNWMAATDVGTLFLDSQLRIKRFTPHIASFFNITKNDEGRPITDFTHRLKYGNLISDARTVLTDLVPFEREVESGDGKWFIIRFRPYRTMDDKIEGIVVTFVDFTKRRSAEAALQLSQTRLQLAREAADIGIQDYDPATDEFWLDDRAAKFWKLPAEQKAPADAIWSRINAEDLQGVKAAFEGALDPAGEGHFAAEFRLASRAENECWIRATGKALFIGSGSDKHAERLVVTVQDISEWKLWDRRQRLIVKELTHRVKNTLAVVQSMARQTFRNSKNVKADLTSFEGRLHALSRAHDLLLQENWNGAGLKALVTSQLGAQLIDGRDRVEIRGPEVMLPGRLATPFGLLLHELATNALKYGSLSTEKGRVMLEWQLKKNTSGNVLAIQWVEKGGPRPHVQPAGFGSFIIDNGLPGAEVKREFRPEGLICTVSVPLTDAEGV